MGAGGDRRTAVSARVAAHPNAAAVAVFALVIGVYLWPVLVGGKIFSPNAALYGFVPWLGSVPPDVFDYLNGTLLDLPLANHPWRVLIRDLLHEGTFPAWNPYVLGGIPLFPNVQTGLFSPFNVPLWTLPLTYGLGVSAALKLLAGAFGMYLLVRQLRLGFLPGLLAGVAFAFCAANVVWLPHETLPAVLMLLPWAVWLIERILERGRPGSAIGLAIVVAIALGGGHPGMQVHLLAVVGAYAILRVAIPVQHDSVTRGRALALVFGGVAGGVLLMAFMLLPEQRLAHDTVGVAERRSGELPGQQMPFGIVQTVLFPDRWGRPSAVEFEPFRVSAFESAQFIERTFYPGAVALLLAMLAAFRRDAWRQMAPFALRGILGLAIALRAPGLHWLVMHLPVLSLVEPQRLHFLFEFAVAVLAAFGLQTLIDAPRGSRWRLAIPLVALLVGGLAMATAGADPGDLGRTVRHFLTGEDFRLPGVLALTSAVWFLLFAAGVGLALLLARARPGWCTAIAVALVALAVVDALHFAHGWAPMGPERAVIPPRTPAVAFLEEHRADGRIVGLQRAMPNDWALVYGLEDVRGYDPPQPTRRMLGMWRLVNPSQKGWVTLDVLALDEERLRVLSALGARWIVTDPRARLDDDLGLRTAYEGPDARILDNAGVAPRAVVPARVLVAADDRAARARIVEAGFDPRTTAVIEAGGDGASDAASLPARIEGTAAVVQRRNASVTLRADLDSRGLVVLNEALTEGWTVEVDGRTAAPLHVNTVMRGVIVPPGEHEIEWRYEVPRLRLGLLVSLVTLLALSACAIALAVRGRRDAPRR